jgi:hypothetical protein
MNIEGSHRIEHPFAVANTHRIGHTLLRIESNAYNQLKKAVIWDQKALDFTLAERDNLF